MEAKEQRSTAEVRQLSDSEEDDVYIQIIRSNELASPRIPENSADESICTDDVRGSQRGDEAWPIERLQDTASEATQEIEVEVAKQSTGTDPKNGVKNITNKLDCAPGTPKRHSGLVYNGTIPLSVRLEQLAPQGVRRVPESIKRRSPIEITPDVSIFKKRTKTK